MSLLDDARRLRTETYTSETFDAGYQEFCVRCNHRLDQGHAPDCPWLAMPGIVAAMEAAERVTSLEHDPDPVNCFSRCHWCDEFAGTEEHRPDCPWQALVVALKGDVVP